jgi:GTP:adenosylcobinamide-phosphate guanylyltransferase
VTISQPGGATIHGTWTAILLAGDRPGGDPLARHFGLAHKALITIQGRSMLRRVADALLAAPEIRHIVILAQDPKSLMVGDASCLCDNPRVSLATGGWGIAGSIGTIAGTARAPFPLLVTTADHALLTPEIVSEFLAGTADCDLAVGVGERSTLEGRYPQNRRTWLKFSDGHYSGANLFALKTIKVAAALALWENVEQDRKKAFKIMTRFGPRLLLRALTRSIGFADALGRAGARLSLRAKPVVLSAPEAAIDVDKLADFELVETILQKRAAESG